MIYLEKYLNGNKVKHLYYWDRPASDRQSDREVSNILIIIIISFL